MRNPIQRVRSWLEQRRFRAEARGGLLGAARPGAHRLTGGANPKAAKRAGEVARAKADDAYDGLAEEIGEVIEELTDDRGEKPSLRAIADALTSRGHTTRRGKRWNATQVKRVLERMRPYDRAIS